MRNIFCTLCGKKHAPCFSLTSNTDEVLRDKIIQHAYFGAQQPCDHNENYKSCHSADRENRRRAPHLTRARERGEKCAMQHIVRCTCTHAWDGYVSRVPASPPGAKESHIHEIYSGIALLEHLRTMTMHPDALLPARRAIRVMHRNAPCDDCPLTLSFSRNFFALLRKEGRTRDGWFALRKVIGSTSRKVIYFFHTR